MRQPPKILIVEDEEAIRIGLMDVLLFHGYDVEWAEEGISGLEKALSGRFDLILLDVMLPNINGFDICHQIREQDPEQPIIMLTAKSADEDVINGLTLGADDYVAKPFSITQLILRIKAVLRRSSTTSQDNPIIHISERCAIDVLNLSANIDGSDEVFTKREMDVIVYLHQNADRPVSREELLCKVWGYSQEMEIETRTVDIHIGRIRRKIELDAKSPMHLLTIRGAGYRLICDARS